MKKLLFLAVIVAIGFAAYQFREQNNSLGTTGTQVASLPANDPARTMSAREIAQRTWGHPASLPDHFARHGGDFGARSPDEYAVMAYLFLRRAKVEGYRAKLDGEGVLRVYDSKSGAFGAYNHNGTTKTFFKPGNPRYFDRQPGQPFDLRNSR